MKPFRIRAGRYNYRAYCFSRRRGAWVLFTEDGGVFASCKTIRAMCALIDRTESKRRSA